MRGGWRFSKGEETASLLEAINEALDEGRFGEFRSKYSPLLESKLED